jgi:endonuclease G
VQVPKRFWKVAAFVRTDGSMGAAGFIVSQEELLAAMGLEATAEHMARTFQERISVIEQATKLDFGALRTMDTLGRAGLLEGVEAPAVELTSFEQIKL